MLFILNCTSLPEVRRVDIRWRQWSCETSSKKSNEPLRSNLPNVSWFWIVGLLFMKGLLDSKDSTIYQNQLGTFTWNLVQFGESYESISSTISKLLLWHLFATKKQKHPVGSIDRKSTSERERGERKTAGNCNILYKLPITLAELSFQNIPNNFQISNFSSTPQPLRQGTKLFQLARTILAGSENYQAVCANSDPIPACIRDYN